MAGFDEERKYLKPLVVSAQILGLAPIIAIIYYSTVDVWDITGLFDIHPILMIASFVYLNGTAILLYRTFGTYRKGPVKAFHGVVQLLGLVGSIGGVGIAVYTSMLTDVPHFFTLHSWIGGLTVVSFLIQWILSAIIFGLPSCADSVRSTYKNVHTYCGGAIMYGSIISVVTGITEKSYNYYEPFEPLYILMNSIGLMSIFFAIVVSIVIRTDAYKRQDVSLLATKGSSSKLLGPE